MLCLKDDRTIGETYNLGRGESHSLYEIGDKVAKILGVTNVEYQQMPEINGEAFEIRSDIGKATALGWTPTRSIETALEDTIAYLKNQVEMGYIDPKTFMANVKIESVKIG